MIKYLPIFKWKVNQDKNVRQIGYIFEIDLKIIIWVVASEFNFHFTWILSEFVRLREYIISLKMSDNQKGD